MSAAITGAIGVATITQPRTIREMPLAAMPLVFSAQQTVEGILWLTLPAEGGGVLSSLLTHLYLGFALAFWPVYAPVSAWLIEPRSDRRWAMAACLLVGVGVALYFVSSVLTLPHAARVDDGHIVYTVGVAAPFSVGGLYLFATGIALAFSSYRPVALVGVIVFVGSVASHAFYYHAFVSVWCVFAAASSILLLVHFYRSHSPKTA